jgi:16S rRNA (guanine527-N7)-methyltransferase
MPENERVSEFITKWRGDEALRKFEHLREFVSNSSVNVTAIRERDEFYLKHILDSIYIFRLREIPFETAADIGSGGGFPGFPISIIYPDRKITLVESVGKKCRFLKDCALQLSLKNIDIRNSRAEDTDGTFDLITARGVARVKDILKYTLHLSQKNTVWLLYKGERVSEELVEAEEIFKKREIKSEVIRIEEPFKRSYLFLRYI